MVFVLVLFWVFLSGFSKLKATTINEVLDQIQLFYDQIRTIKAEFVQETWFPSGKVETRTGKMWMKKPGKLRWEYLHPERFVIISDGKHFYFHYPEEKQTFLYPNQEFFSSQLILGFMNGVGNIKKDLKLESFRVLEKGFWEISFSLLTKNHLNLDKITLTVKPSTGEVKQIQLLYTTGERVKINLKKINYNLELKDSIFK